MSLPLSTRVLMIAVVLLFSACTTYKQPIAATQLANQEKTYLYGRLGVEGAGQLEMQMGLVFKRLDQEGEVLIKTKSKEEDAVYAIEIDPGQYSYDAVVFTTGWSMVDAGRDSITNEKVKRPIDYRAGNAYYIGDFEGKTSSTLSGNVIRKRWAMGPPKDNYEKTTEELKSKFVGLRNIPTHNMTLNDPEADKKLKEARAKLLKALMELRDAKKKKDASEK